MVEHKGMVIPKSYRNTTEKLFNMSKTWIAATCIFAFFSGIISLFALFSTGLVRLFFIIVVLLIWFLYIKKFRNDELLEHSKLLYLYYIRKKRGDTILYKYGEQHIEMILRFLLGITLFPKGLIRSKDGLYFLLLRYIPPRSSDEIREAFFHNTVSLLNSLPSGVAFMFYVVSRNETENIYEKQLIEAAKHPLTTESGKTHLYSLHKMITEQTENNIDWDFIMQFSLGKFDTPEEAESSRQSLLTGLRDQLAVVETDSHVIEDPREITYLIYQSINQMR